MELIRLKTILHHMNFSQIWYSVTAQLCFKFTVVLQWTFCRSAMHQNHWSQQIKFSSCGTRLKSYHWAVVAWNLWIQRILRNITFSLVVVELDSIPDVVHQYKDVFDESEVGDLGGGKLMVDSSVPTHVARARKVPIVLKDRAKMKLNQMVAQGIIAPQDAPKDWVSNMVVGEKKKGDLRICIDPKPLNEALKRKHFQMPTLDDVLPKLSKARVFTTAVWKIGTGMWSWIMTPVNLLHLPHHLAGIDGYICHLAWKCLVKYFRRSCWQL